jgi:hypothetical protein
MNQKLVHPNYILNSYEAIRKRQRERKEGSCKGPGEEDPGVSKLTGLTSPVTREEPRALHHPTGGCPLHSVTLPIMMTFAKEKVYLGGSQARGDR